MSTVRRLGYIILPAKFRNSIQLQLFPLVMLFLVRTVIQMEGLQSKLAQIFASLRLCVLCMNQLRDQGHTQRPVCDSSACQGCKSQRDFKITWHKCLAQVFALMRWYFVYMNQRCVTHRGQLTTILLVWAVYWPW